MYHPACVITCVVLPASLQTPSSCRPIESASTTAQAARICGLPTSSLAGRYKPCGSLPLNPRIEAWNSLAPINVLPRNLHLPHGLRAAILRYLIEDSCRAWSSRCFAVLHVPVFQQGGIPPEKRVGGGRRIERKRCCLRRLVELQERYCAVKTWWWLPQFHTLRRMGKRGRPHCQRAPARTVPSCLR